MIEGKTSVLLVSCAKCARTIDIPSAAMITVDGQTYHLGCAPGRSVSDDSMRLRRIERDLRDLAETIREQAAGEQDGYLLSVADDIRRILA